MSIKNGTLSLCLLLIVHPALFGMEPKKPSSWKVPAVITGVVVVGVGAVGATLWRRAHSVKQHHADMEVRARINKVTTTADANSLWEEIWQSYNKALTYHDLLAAQQAMHSLEALYGYCNSTTGLKTEEDLAIWQGHLQSFREKL
jgi:hypothetical protein